MNKDSNKEFLQYLSNIINNSYDHTMLKDTKKEGFNYSDVTYNNPTKTQYISFVKKQKYNEIFSYNFPELYVIDEQTQILTYSIPGTIIDNISVDVKGNIVNINVKPTSIKYQSKIDLRPKSDLLYFSTSSKPYSYKFSCELELLDSVELHNVTYTNGVLSLTLKNTEIPKPVISKNVDGESVDPLYLVA